MAIDISSNHYERALESWLIDNRLGHMIVDQHKRRVFADCRIKSFDFLLYPADSKPMMAEVKGRKFKGSTLAGKLNLENWVTMDDIRGLISWERVFEGCFEAVFIFAYKFERIDVETDGRDVYDFEEGQYIFYAVRLDDYRAYMTIRSPKWQTVTIPAAKFRKLAVPLEKFISGKKKDRRVKIPAGMINE